MTAGITRVVEVCFVVPSLEKDAPPPPSGDSDNQSEHTLGGPTPTESASKLAVVQAFRHLPPFVCL